MTVGSQAKACVKDAYRNFFHFVSFFLFLFYFQVSGVFAWNEVLSGHTKIKIVKRF